MAREVPLPPLQVSSTLSKQRLEDESHKWNLAQVIFMWFLSFIMKVLHSFVLTETPHPPAAGIK